MPRNLPVGNGRLLVNFDDRGTLRDVYYPYPGQENHTDGGRNRFGVWAANSDGGDARFAWTDWDGWERTLRYRPGTLVTNVQMRHGEMQTTLHIQDAVDFNRDVYIKKVVVHNDADHERTVRLFFHFDACLWGNNIGDTGYYDPRSKGIIFYKGKRYFLLNARVGEATGLAQWAIGQKGIAGREGTWRDAEDGQLSGNPVAQGAVDGVGGVEVRIPAGGNALVYWWLAAGDRVGVVGDLDRRMRERNPEVYLARTEDYWRIWLNKESRTYANLSARAIQCAERSLLVLRTNIAENGAIIAATDADIQQFGLDTYAYVWPRDGALVAFSLIRNGYADITRTFFRFIGNIISHEGYLLHKYNPDGSMGSTWHPFIDPQGAPQLPIQEDETALVIAALWEHFRTFREIEFVSPLYRPLVRAGAEFMVRFREPHTGLPAASYDLWEERHGIHAWTVGTVWGGLMAAANFAEAFGQHVQARHWRETAEEIRRACDAHLWDEERGRFLRRIVVLPDGTIEKDTTIDGSVIGLVNFGMYAPHNPRIVATMQAVEEATRVRTDVGGYARYQNDYYQQVSGDVTNCPGNPWFICTLWVADYEIQAARTLDDLKHPAELIEWVAAHALSSDVLAEQVHPYTGAPLSVSPLTWSHAAYAGAVRLYADTWHALSGKDGAGAAPKLAPHLDELPTALRPPAPGE